MKKHRLVFKAVDRDGWVNIRSGHKSVETRAATIKYRNIQAGDVLVVVCGKDSFEKSISIAEYYDSIESLMAGVPMTTICPDTKSMDDVYKMYYRFPGYKEKIAEHGIMAFYLS